VAELAHYGVEVGLVDHVDELHASERALTFNFHGGRVTSPERCASLVGATVLFDGRLVSSLNAGGWAVTRIPTNTAPGETINLDHCETPFMQLVFVPFEGEPQNGTLAIEGEGKRFEVIVARALGNPELTLVSATTERVVLRVANFPVGPALRDFSVMFSPTGGTSSRLQLEEGPVAGDGLVEAPLPASASVDGGLNGILSVSVQLDHQALECHGFTSCDLGSLVLRHLSVVVPRP
jgi:hypothetical protein